MTTVENTEFEKVALFKVLRGKQKQFKKLIEENDVKFLFLAKRYVAEISALVTRYNALTQ